RMTMAHALEARSPFLDARVVELALAWPAWLKRDTSGGKRILKQTFGSLFPPGFLDRPKTGFSVPVDEWLRAELRLRLEARLFRGVLADAGILEPAAVRGVVRGRAGRRSRGPPRWDPRMRAWSVEALGRRTP